MSEDKGALINPPPPLPKLPSKEELAVRREAEGFVIKKHEPSAEPVAAPVQAVAALDEVTAPAGVAAVAAEPAVAPARPVAAAPAIPAAPVAEATSKPAAAPKAAQPPKPAAAPAAKPAPAAAPAAKPAAPSARPAPALQVSRRQFVSWFTIGWSAFTLASLGALSTLVRFLFPNVLFEPPSSFKAGFPDQYTVGQVNEDYKNKFGVWIVRDEGGIYALSTTCTHLGCIPNWLATEEKFKCPCHGSGYYITGVNFEGPAPRPLERYRVAWADDGQILVDKTRKFQFELGQWADPDALLKLA